MAISDLNGEKEVFLCQLDQFWRERKWDALFEICERNENYFKERGPPPTLGSLELFKIERALDEKEIDSHTAIEKLHELIVHG